MGKRLILAVAAVSVLAIAAAGALAAGAREMPTVVRAGNLVLTLNGNITPTRLPKREPVAVGFHASGALATVDGSHPPAWRESSFDVSKDISIDVHGIPTCRKEELVARSTSAAEAACGDAVLGTGKGSVEVAFPEQAPIEATGPILLVNGGEKGGVVTFYLHTYVSIPAPTAVVATAKVTKENKGPYGLHIQVMVPRIAGGSGSITNFELSANRYVSVNGKRQGFLFARCSDGRFQAKGTVVFSDGSSLSGGIVRTCTSTG
jgi:hypothetical protein